MKSKILPIIIMGTIALCGFSRAITVNKTPTKVTTITVNKKSEQPINTTKNTIQNLYTHKKIIEDITSKNTITRAEFGYLLHLLTPEKKITHTLQKCTFSDENTIANPLIKSAIKHLCHKHIVGGTKEKYLYNKNINEAEVVTMIARTLNQKEAIEPSNTRDRYKPYYQWFKNNNITIQKSDNPTQDIPTQTALDILTKTIGSRKGLTKKHIIISTPYQTEKTTNTITLKRNIYDIHGEKISIADDSVSVSIEPYRDSIVDENIFVAKECTTLTQCLTTIEFTIPKENNRTNYCGTITYAINAPYTQKVSEDFCINQ